MPQIIPLLTLMLVCMWYEESPPPQTLGCLPHRQTLMFPHVWLKIYDSPGYFLYEWVDCISRMHHKSSGRKVICPNTFHP